MMTLRKKLICLGISRVRTSSVAGLSVGTMVLLLGAASTITMAAGSRTATSTTAYCSSTADMMYTACGSQIVDDYWTASAKCLNLSENQERSACQNDAAAERTAGQDLCNGQRAARLEACSLLGEARYDPEIDPIDFDSDYTHLSNPNPYFPLTIGNRWEYRTSTEFNTVEILNHTKLIDDITCIVALDQVFTGGDLTEKTNDWFCQKKDSTVWYFGEETAELESFDGDIPRLPEIVTIDGSFKADRDNDKGGIIFLASPKKDDAYYEEFSLGNAEDITVVLSVAYKYGSDRDLDRHVPRSLAELFCSSSDCVVTRNTSQLEPGAVDRKYYAKGIGVFLEVSLDTKVATPLTGCNFDPRCAQLPVH